jgi:NAD(P)H-flavin reductase
MGKCIYAANADQPLLLTAIGTGLAPVYGIVRQALISGHQTPIHLLVGARNRAGFYLVEELQALAQQYDNLTVHFICQDAAPDFALQDDIYSYYKQQFADLKNWQVYLCGAESFVKKMRKQSFLAGAAMSDISADSFLAFNN